MKLPEFSEVTSQVLRFFETERIKETIMNLDERGFLILGGATALLVILCLLKKMVRSAVIILAICATVVLLHFSIPEEGQDISLPQIVQLFVGGSFIVGNIFDQIFYPTVKERAEPSQVLRRGIETLLVQYPRQGRPGYQ